ncbi:cytochrome P450 71AU50-like [Magnolia sinica]|uniref:cytochrome P450 71AU50-like n=1 Tax=Magnolia sinica TaxID=86752 RepID=UPI00265A1DD4|nr:cytochrome P450 71AU50-like [Magnolia sinica]
MLSWMTLLLIALVGFWPIVYLIRPMRGDRKRTNGVGIKGTLPPGPQGLPILGSLLTLGNLPHRTLHRLANKYGPIMYMQLGLVPTIIVSSPQVAQQFLKKYDLIFATRPDTKAGHYMSFGRKGISFAPYGHYWRNMHKFCMIELLSNLKIESFRSMRREELVLLVQSLKDASAACLPANLTIKVASFTTDITCRMVFGEKKMNKIIDEQGFKEFVEEVTYLAGAFNIADYIPCIGPLDLQGLRRRMKTTNKFFDSLFEKIIDEHLQHSEVRHQRDFVDFMLSFMTSDENQFQFNRSNIKAILLEMLLAALDTSSTTIDWALSELIKHPRVMKKAQQELESIVGMERMVEESDLENLEYLDMVVKETMRLHPVVPLLLPREAMEDCTVNSFHIPKKSRIIVNAWAIGRDPNVWSNPEEFYPERFAGTSIDVRGHDFELLPFGSGRRGCPGMQLGLMIVQLVLAQLVHCFDWELPNGMSPDDMDMTEKFGIVMPRINHLWAAPTYRLRDDISAEQMKI